MSFPVPDNPITVVPVPTVKGLLSDDIYDDADTYKSDKGRRYTPN